MFSKSPNQNVAIMMATYNGGRFLAEQIDSILSQTYRNWVLFIRDDGSTDSTLDVIANYVKRYPERVLAINDPSLKGGGSKENFAAILGWVKKTMTLSTSCSPIRMTYGCLIRLTLSSRLANMRMTMDQFPLWSTLTSWLLIKS